METTSWPPSEGEEAEHAELAGLADTGREDVALANRTFLARTVNGKPEVLELPSFLFLGIAKEVTRRSNRRRNKEGTVRNKQGEQSKSQK